MKRVIVLLLSGVLLLCALPVTAAGSSFETTQRVLPQLVRQTEGYSGYYHDTAYSTDGRIAAVGRWYSEPESTDTFVIDLYDEDLHLLKSCEVDVWYSEIEACRDGGFILDNDNGNCRLDKFSADLEFEWSVALEEDPFTIWVTSVTQLTDGTIVAVYAMPYENTWKLAFVSENGQLLKKLDLGLACEDSPINFTPNYVLTDFTVSADAAGGFYLFVTADAWDVNSYGKLYLACDPDKGSEAVVTHFSSEGGEWILDYALAVGGVDDEWCEEAAVDEEGNFYVALGKIITSPDPFWDEIVPYYFARRMLVKVSPTGEILYRVALSGRSRGVDQVFGIHTRDGQVFVTGSSYLHDDVLLPLIDAWSDDYSICVAYGLQVNADGNVASRQVFRYNWLWGEPGGSVLLPDSRLVLCGNVSGFDSDFDVEFESDYPYHECTDRALFIYEPKLITQVPATAAYAAMGEKVSVNLSAAGKGLTYRWYFKNAGATKYSRSSVTAPTYTTTMSDTVKGRRIYCVVTDAYGRTETTKTFILREAVSITAQPQTVTAPKGSAAKVTVKASGDGLKYQWYVKNEGTAKYSKSAITKATYSVTMTDNTKNRLLYCVVKDQYGNTVQTKTVRLREAVSVVTQPKTVSVAKGKTAKTTAKASGDGLKYQWYVKDAGASKYVKSSITSATYSVKMSAKVNGRRLLCYVTDKYGNRVQTKTVTLKMK